MSVVTVTVLAGGQAISAEAQLLSVDVRREVNRIPGARLSFIDGDVPQRKFPLSDTAVFDPGVEVEIKARYEGGPGGDVTLFKGLVVRHSLEVRSLGSLLHVDLKDKAVKMTRARQSKVTLDAKDADVFKTLAGAAGLKAGTIDATDYQHKAMVQYQCTDWDFLLARAQSLGHQVCAVDGVLSVRKVAIGSAKLKLEYGLDEVYDWEFEFDGVEQMPGIDGVGWSPKDQATVKASGAAAAEAAQGTTTAAKAAGAIGMAARTLVHGVPIEQPELKAWADGQLTRSRMAMLRGRVSIAGRGDVQLLDVVEFAGMGKRFNGKGLVSGLAHRIDNGAWRTDLQFGLSVSGLIDDAAASPAPAAGLLPAVGGLQIGIVKAIGDDPDQAMRVQISLPMLGDGAPEVWARWAFPDAGNGRGIIFWPEPGDEVVVGFFNDDPRQPVVLGSLYSAKQVPPAPYDKPDDKNLARGLFTKSGSEIGFVDDDGKPQIFVRTKTKRQLLLDDDGKAITLADGDGNKITMDANGITIHSAKDFKVEADGNVEIKGTQIDLK